MIQSSQAAANSVVVSLNSVEGTLDMGGTNEAYDCDLNVEATRTVTFLQTSDMVASLGQAISAVALTIEGIASEFEQADTNMASELTRRSLAGEL